MNYPCQLAWIAGQMELIVKVAKRPCHARKGKKKNGEKQLVLAWGGKPKTLIYLNHGESILKKKEHTYI